VTYNPNKPLYEQSLGMQRSRSHLHKNQLASFIAFCESKDWEKTTPRGPFEVLRMAKENRLLIVHTKMGAEHLTTWGESATMLNQFLRAKREGKWSSASSTSSS
jgi:hypothetical protein